MSVSGSHREQLREDVARFLVDRIAAARGTSVGKADVPLAFFLADSLLDTGLLVQPTAPIERIEAMMRLLVDSGDMTPMAVRQLRAVLVAEFPDHPESVLDEYAGE